MGGLAPNFEFLDKIFRQRFSPAGEDCPPLLSFPATTPLITTEHGRRNNGYANEAIIRPPPWTAIIMGWDSIIIRLPTIL